MNFERKSTRGFSIAQMILDFTGGILSNGQLGIDSYLQNDWSGIWGNPVKLLLANLSIFFDVIFFVQHFWLYRGAEEKEGDGRVGRIDEIGQEDPLLGGIRRRSD
jgi:cystinosin